MFIASVSGSLPDHFYDQDTLIQGFLEQWSEAHHNADRLVRLHQAVAVSGRHLALPMERYPTLSFSEANDAFISVGTQLGAKAIRNALDSAGLHPEDVDVIFTTTVTGVATPSLDARLVNTLGFRSDVKRIPMFGLGCVAGAAGTARLADYLRGHPDQVGILLSVELCSLTIQRRDFSVANLIASGLFGDGAAALVGVGHKRAEQMGLRAPRVLTSKSRFYPDTERVMGWDVGDTGFQVVLDASVPDVVQTHIRADADAFLSENNLTLADISRWIAHPGGPKVLKAFEQSLDLPKSALQLTWDSLNTVGNLSSASVLFVLRDALETPAQPNHKYGLMIAMGPGFCSEFVLLQWDGV